ncbi:MAG: molybdenum cofactor guanylyltransferase, partial [Planctomycetes bacterium]|nr:molybdenum cofactor guanylyltransferase [Planctomycetota bacterium]
MTHAGIILCGGRSTRMGRDKATLPFGPELMLQRVVRLLGEAVERIVIVAAPGQELPPLLDEVKVVHDQREGRGPLEGLAAGLRALTGKSDAAFVTSCDVPLLEPAFVRRMFELLGEHQIVVPKDEKYHHPLAAVYRADVLPHVEQLLAADRMRPFFLFEMSDTLEIDAEQMRAVDAELGSLRNINRPEDYGAALVTESMTGQRVF